MMVDYILELLARSLILGSAATVVAYLAAEAGILHVASAGLMGVGAYTSVLAAARLDLPASVTLLLTLPIGVACGAIFHVLTRRLTAAYLAMVTLGMTVILHGLMTNWVSLTGGPMGIANVPTLPSLLGRESLDFLVLTVLLVAVASRLPRTSFGLRVQALRDDELLSEDLRLQPQKVRCTLFVGSSCILTFLGGLYAHHLRFVDPSSFSLRESIAILAMALVMPVRVAFKGVTGGLLFVLAPEILRLVGLPPAFGAQLRQALFALLLLMVVWKRWLPGGKVTAKGEGIA